MDETGGVKTKHLVAEGEDWRERFREMLTVMGVEELIRYRHRLGKLGCARLVKILSLEIARREG
jgi:hypothetical protein